MIASSGEREKKKWGKERKEEKGKEKGRTGRVVK